MVVGWALMLGMGWPGERRGERRGGGHREMRQKVVAGYLIDGVEGWLDFGGIILFYCFLSKFKGKTSIMPLYTLINNTRLFHAFTLFVCFQNQCTCTIIKGYHTY